MNFLSSLSRTLRALTITTAVPAFTLSAEACTAFQFVADGKPFVAKNHDFVMGHGLMVVNRRAIQKHGVGVEQPMSWTSRYGSLTYNQFGMEMPNGGMNEAGLVVEMLWLEEADFAAADARKELDVLQWIQYQLDTAETVDEVIASDRNLRIKQGVGRVHFFVADKRGGIVVLEHLQGKLHVHRDSSLPVPVLANDLYTACVRALDTASILPVGQSPDWTGLPSMARFAAVSAAAKGFDSKTASPSQFALDTLERARHEDFTQFQWVYDSAGAQVSLRRKIDRTVRTIRMIDLDFAAHAPQRVAVISDPGELVWVDGNLRLNREVMGKSYSETPFLRHITSEQIDQMAAVPAQFRAAD